MIERWSQVQMFLLSKWSAVGEQGWLQFAFSQSTSISFAPGFVCWLPFPSAPCLAIGSLWAPLFWSFTSGASSTEGFGLLITGLHTSSSSLWVRSIQHVGKGNSLIITVRNKSLVVVHIPVFWKWFLLLWQRDLEWYRVCSVRSSCCSSNPCFHSHTSPQCSFPLHSNAGIVHPRGEIVTRKLLQKIFFQNLSFL